MTFPPPAPSACQNPACPSTTTASTDLQPCPRCLAKYFCSPECRRQDSSSTCGGAKPSCPRPNYILRVQLHPREITNPPIERTISCPANATFYKLHGALQVAFGWSSSHLHHFTVSTTPTRVNRRTATAPAAGLDRFDSFLNSMPRTLLTIVEGSTAYDDPVDDFLFGGLPPLGMDPLGLDGGDGSGDKKDGKKLKLFKVFGSSKYSGTTMVYEYDLGDGWEHQITVVGRDAPTRSLVCLAGSGHPAAEDVGGAYGWENLKEAYRAARPDASQRESRRWYQDQASNGDPLGLAGDRVNTWDREQVNRDLASFIRIQVAA